MVHQWFALRVRSRSEKAVALAVEQQGYEQFLPLYKSPRRLSEQVKWADLPLFPRYVFCRLDAVGRLDVLSIPGTMEFVGIGNEPMPLDPAEIEVIRTAVLSDVGVEPWTYTETGTEVTLLSGPLAGTAGILIQGDGCQRLAISLDILQRSVAFKIEPAWLQGTDVRGSSARVQTRSSVPYLLTEQRKHREESEES